MILIAATRCCWVYRVSGYTKCIQHGTVPADGRPHEQTVLLLVAGQQLLGQTVRDLLRFIEFHRC